MALVKYNNNSISAVTSAASIPSGAMTHIKTLTASSSSSLSFLNGSSDVVLDNTYPIYVFKYINIHASADDVILAFQADTGTNTSYNQTVTSTFFSARHGEDDSNGNINYVTNRDQAQGTSDIKLNYDTGNQTTSECVSGTLHLFNPSSSTFVKHFISVSSDSGYTSTGSSQNNFVAGYFNTTTALTRVRFKMTSGNIDSGTIKLYGIKDS